MLHWDTSCVDWERRIVARETLILFDPLFPSEAEAALEVFKSLHVVDATPVYDPILDVTRPPTFGEVCDEWVFDFVRAIFGAYDPDSATRLIQNFFMLISKKNGKSTIAAAIMLTALVRNWRHSAELLLLAPTIEIANNSFFPARDMVRANPRLSTLLHIQENFRQITHRMTKAVLKVVAADTDTVGGKKAGFVLVDELWLFGKRASADSMLKEATGGLASRPEGFVIYLSTQSDVKPAGVFKAKLDYFRKVRDGEIKDPKSLGVLYEFPAAMLKSKAYMDPENFYITNPNLNRSVQKQFLVDKLTEAQGGDLGMLATHLAKHHNVEIGIGFRSDGWAGAAVWSRGIDKTLTLESLLERCEVVTGGIDGGGLDDLLGLAFIGREKETKRWLGWARAFISPEGLERRKANRSVYDGFRDDGDLIYVEDLPGDVNALVAVVEQVLDSGLLHQIGVDPVGLGIIVDALALIGVSEEAENLIGVRQGIGLMGAIKTVERRLADGSFKHPGQPMMAWCAGNAIVQPTPTGMRIVRDASGYGKIDPLMALNDAAHLMATNPDANTSRYDKEGIRSL